MGEAAWKSDERRVAEILGGVRVPGRRGTDEVDVTHPRFAVEVKRRTQRMRYLDEAMEQAVKASVKGFEADGRERLPMVVLHYTGTQMEASALVIVRLGSFLKFLGRLDDDNREIYFQETLVT